MPIYCAHEHAHPESIDTMAATSVLHGGKHLRAAAKHMLWRRMAQLSEL